MARKHSAKGNKSSAFYAINFNNQSVDILIRAVGRPGLVTAEMVKTSAVVVDVGISRVTDSNGKSRLVGDKE